MEEKEIQKRIKQGAILAQVSFEVVGNPKDYVETTIKGFVNNIKNDSDITFLNEEFGEPEEVPNSQGLWSTYADTEVLVNSLDKFVWLCVNFLPATIEIIAPEELRFSDKDLTNWLNDILAKLHEISVTVRQTNVKNEVLVQNMNALIQNAIIITTEHYHKPAEIGKKVGIDEKQLQPFFEALVKQGKLEKKGDEYYHGKGQAKAGKAKGEGGKKDGAKKRS